MNVLAGIAGRTVFVGFLSVVVFFSECNTSKYDINNKYTTLERADKGLVVILPGIEGESGANRDIRAGLYKADIPYALVIYRWGSLIPGPGGMLINQTNTSRDRRMGQELAEQIAQYQLKHPGKPVFIIGHSGGGGIAIFTLESLGRIPGAEPIEGAFLLSASISANYNLSSALRMTKLGIVNVSNSGDNLLSGGTATFGNVDGGHGDSAGRTGFTRLYAKVYERPITNKGVWEKEGIVSMPHLLATKEKLIEKYAPAWIMSPAWPPARPGTNPLKQ